MKKPAATLVILVLVFVASNAAGSQQADVKITDPTRDDLPVGKGMTVKGTGTIPGGHHLWILVRRVDFDGVWWPQGEAKIDPVTKEWRVGVTFGNKDDIS